MTVYVADTHAYVQRLVSVAKLPTVLEACTTEEQSSVMRFLCAKELNAKDIHKEIFTVYSGKYLSRNAVHSWMTNVSLMTKRFKRR
jgi:hypothetical protein